MNKTDKRFASAEAKITNSFNRLIRQKDFSQITVSMIVRESNINRSTFYAHYEDIFDLSHHIQSDILHELSSIINHTPIDLTSDAPAEEEDLYRYFSDVVNFLSDNGELLLLFMQNTDGSFEARFHDLCRSIWNGTGSAHSLVLPVEYVAAGFGGMITGILSEWIKGDFKDSKESLITAMVTISKKLPQVFCS